METEMEEYCITSKNDMYIFFQLIDMIEPRSVLDAGCFLKRAGAVSRNVLDKSIDESVRLDAIDIGGVNIPVCKTIYNNIFCTDELESVAAADLAMMLDLTDIFTLDELKKIMSWSAKHVKYIVADSRTYDVCKNCMAAAQIEDTKFLKLDDDVYYLIVLKRVG